VTHTGIGVSEWKYKVSTKAKIKIRFVKKSYLTTGGVLSMIKIQTQSFYLIPFLFCGEYLYLSSRRQTNQTPLPQFCSPVRARAAIDNFKRRAS